jgi:hypothetical protein
MRENEERLAAFRAALKTGDLIQVSPRRIAVRDGRRPIDPETLARLTESIAKVGMLQPIVISMGRIRRERPYVVRPPGGGRPLHPRLRPAPAAGGD